MELPKVQRIHAQGDGECIKQAGGNVFVYLVLKLAARLRMRANKPNGPAAWEFSTKRVTDLHCGYLWSHGGSEQQTELSFESQASILAGGSQWWPVIWVDVFGGIGILIPVHCPGLAWQNARPAWAHRSRLQEVDRPQAMIDSLLMIGDVLSYFAAGGGFSTADRR